MNRILFRGLVCLSLLMYGHSFALANNDPLSLTGSPAPSPEVYAVPEATALDANWWKFFQFSSGSPADAYERIQRVEEQLSKLIPSLAPDIQDTALALKNRTLSNLRALAASGEQKAPAAPSAVSFKEAYSIEQWLELERLYRNKHNELSDELAAINQLEKAVTGAAKKHDNEMASYIDTDATATDKAMRGMEIMHSRSALELARQRLSRYQLGYKNLSTSIEALSSEKKIAAERLTASEEALIALKQQRRDQEQLLSRASTRLSSAQSRTLGAIDETPSAIADYRLLEQRVIHAAVDETIARLQLAITDGITTLTLLLNKHPFKTNELPLLFKQWQQLTEESQAQINLWKTDSLREQNRSQTQLLRLGSSTAALSAIHQARNQLAQATQIKLLELEDLRLSLSTLKDISQLYQSQQEGGLQRGWTRTLELLQSGWLAASSLTTGSLFKIGDTPVTILGLLRVVLILTLAWTVSSVLRRTLAKIAATHESEGSALYTVGRLAHYVILIAGMMIALSSIGLDFSNLALVAGALSVGIGFGLQSIVNNFVSGLILLFERSLKVGDFIELDSGVLGVIVDINVRSTLINTNDNVDIIVPNSELVGTKVTNWTLRDATRRMRIPFGVAYGADKDLVRTAVLEAAERVPVTLRTPAKYEPQVWLVNFGDSSLNFELIVWVSQAAVKRPSSVAASYLWEIETSLKQHGIEIPFPQRDLNIRSLFDKQGAEAEALFRGKP